jgi:raffinose/stachyose/melibiose transport system permease protein
MSLTLKKRYISPYIGLIPSLAMYGLFILYPIISNFYFALTKFDGVSVSAFVGLDNFRRVFGNELLLNAIKNSFVYAILISVIQNLLAIILAILVSVKIKGAGFFRALYFFPNTMGAFAVAIIWGIIMDPNFGPLTSFAKALGINAVFFGTASSIYTIIFIQIWISFGYAMTIYFANIMSVPGELYEAANIDGAGFFNKIRHILLPLLSPSISINILLSLIGSLKLFDIIFITTKGGPANSTENLPVMIFNQAFSQGEHGYGAALNVVQFFLILVIVTFTTSIQKRLKKER